MSKVTLPVWAFMLVAVGTYYLYNVLDLNNRLPMPHNGWTFGK